MKIPQPSPFFTRGSVHARGWLASLLLFPASIYAAGIWDGGGANGNWDTIANWDDDLLPADGANITFHTENTSGNTATMNGARTIGLLTINNTDATSPAAFTLAGTGNVLTVNTGVTYSSTNATNNARNFTLSPTTIAHGANNVTWTGAGSGTFNINSNLTGTGKITKDGAFNMRLRGDNTGFTGPWEVLAGNLNAESAAAGNASKCFGTGTITFASPAAGTVGTTISMNATENATWTNNIVNNNASTQQASITYQGGALGGGIVSLTGNVSTGPNINTNNRLNFACACGFSPANWTEGRYTLSGDWTNYVGNPTSHFVTMAGRGVLQINAQQSIAAAATPYLLNHSATDQTRYQYNTSIIGTAAPSAKIILNGAFTMPNALTISGTSSYYGYGTFNAFGSSQATGTATLSGALAINGPAAANLFCLTTGTTLNLSGVMSASSPNNRIVINDNYSYHTGATTGTGGLVVRNPVGTVLLSNANTFQAPLTVKAGTLQVGHVNALGGNALNVLRTGPLAGNDTTVSAGATLDLNGFSVVEPLVLNGTGAGSAGALINSQAVTPVTLAAPSGALASVKLTNIGSGYTAVPTVVISGTGSGATATASLGLSDASITLTQGTQTYTAPPVVAITGGGGTGATAIANIASNTGGLVTSITITNPGSGYTTAPTITFSSGTVLVAGTAPTAVGNATNFVVGGVNLTAAGTGYTTPPVVSFTGGSGSGAAGAGVLNSAITLGSDSSVGGAGDIAVAAPVTGGFALTKVGAGTLTLSQPAGNLYTGGTTISAGTLVLGNTSGSATGSGSITIAATGTLKGNGSATGATTVQGTIAPGASIGTLGTGALSFAATGIYAAEINTTTSAADRINAGGPLTITNGAVLTITDLGANDAMPLGTVFTLIDYATSWNGNTFIYAGNSLLDGGTVTIGSNTYAVDYTGGGGDDTALTFTTVSGGGNTPPVPTPQSVTTNEDTAISITLAGTDANDDPLTYVQISTPAKGVLSGTAPNLTYTPNADANGLDSFTFKVNDGMVTSTAATVSITITPINDAPVAAAASLNMEQNVPASVVLVGSDVENSPLTYTIVSPPTKGTLSGTAPNLAYTPNFNTEGADSFSFKVNDGTVDSAPATISITIADGNDIPVASSFSVTTNEDVPAAVTLTGSDEEGGALTYVILSTPKNGSLSGTAPALTYTPAANFSGSDSFTYAVNDGTQLSAAATVSITVTNQPDTPVADAKSISTYADTPASLTLTGSDGDGQTLTFAVVTAPAHGALTGTGTSRTYTPAAGYTGADSFTYTANDGALTSAAATVSINVQAVTTASAGLVLNEIMSSPSPRQLKWDAQGVPRLGSGVAWWEAGYNDAGWLSGAAPLGFGFSGLTTNLSGTMQNKTSQLYIRKTFTATAGDAASTNRLSLLVDYNDGFICFINGREVARAHMGAPNTFVAADQLGYSVTTQNGQTEILLPPANTVLMEGVNTIAIQAQNSLTTPTAGNQGWGGAQTPEFKINAGLRLIGVDNATTVQAFDFDTAAGGLEAHSNTGNVVTNTVSGTRAAGSWLVLSANPASTAPAGQTLSLTGSEISAAGQNGTGALRYAVAQTIGNATTGTLFAPEAWMGGYWENGSVNATTLASTKLSFRYRTTGNPAFGFRIQPTVADVTNVIDGFPVITASANPAPLIDFNNATGATRTVTIPVAGGGGAIADSNPAPKNTYGWFNTSNLKDGSFIFKEDNTVASPAGGPPGVKKMTISKAPSIVNAADTNSWWGWGMQALSIPQWNVSTWDATFAAGKDGTMGADLWQFTGANAAAMTDLGKTRFTFRFKGPAGRRIGTRLQASGSAPLTNSTGGNYNSSFNERIEWPAFTATGAWQEMTFYLGNGTGDNGNVGRFVYWLKRTNTKSFQVLFINVDAPAGYATGDEFFWDDINLFYETPANLDEVAAINYASAAGAGRTLTVNGAGAGAVANFNGTPLTSFTPTHSGTTGLVLRATEDTAAGNGGTAGNLKVEVITPATTGTQWGVALTGLKVNTWTPGNVQPADLTNASIELAIKAPLGETISLSAEPGVNGVGGPANKADFGSYVGTGAWQVIRKEFNGAGNVETFRTYLNTNTTTAFSLVASGNTAATAGVHLQLDDVGVSAWRKYEVTLNQGSEGTTGSRFRDAINPTNRVAFVPALTKASDGSGSLFIDNYSVTYTGPAISAAQTLLPIGASAGPWKYHVGLYEPSGGVVDGGLITIPSGFAIPDGEEGNYDNPSDFTDWLEIYNPTGSAVNMAGWTVSDAAGTPQKFILPAGAVIPANGYLVLACDGRDELNAPVGAARLIHTNFSLSSNGEGVYLANPAGTVVSSITSVPKQVFWSSWGRTVDGTGALGYLTQATPGAANAGSLITERVDGVQFVSAADALVEMKGGRYAGAQSLALTTPTIGAVIRYTTDGSEPLETGGTATTYTGPISLTATGDWKLARCIRAQAFAPAMLASGTNTQTYFIDMDAQISGVPNLVLSGEAEKTFYKPYGVLAIDGGTYGVSAANDIWIPNTPASYNLAIGHGQPFEREAHLEWYFPTGYYPNAAQQPYRGDLGIRYSASPYSRPRAKMAFSSTASPFPTGNPTEKPSFNFYFRSDFGDGTLNYNVFPGYTANEFEHLRLRAGKNDIQNPFITDELLRRLWIETGNVGIKGSIVTTWLNGVYKGYYNLTERVREPMLQAHYNTNDKFEVRYVTQWVDGNAAEIGVNGTTHPPSWNAVLTALNADLTQPANQASVAAKVDLDAWADYFATYNYTAMWDWPWNNYAFYRQVTTTGDNRFKPLAWDMEGGCFALGATDGVTGQPINLNFNIWNYYFHNVPAAQYNGDLINFVRKMRSNPEWRLKVADSVNRLMFNGAALDDRDPDGAGPLVSKFKSLRDALVNETQPVVQKTTGAALNMAWWDTWTNPATGRRTKVLPTGVKGVAGYTLGHLRDPNNAGTYNPADTYWPETEPPVFSQHGGDVPLGYTLTMTSTVAGAAGGSTIYYTLDGSDPRVSGTGAVSGSAYTGAITLNSLSTVSARARNTTTNEWSPITVATFRVAAVPATPGSLVVAEIMYHPQDASAAEAALGFTNADDFEFIRLQNISASPVKLDGVKFTVGITFDFTAGNVPSIEPGQSVLAIHSYGAFQARYGHAYDGMIAGIYTGALKNSGERIALLGPDGEDVDTLPDTLQDFTYLTDGLWPAAPDGHGPSLLLANPASNPNHNVGTNWTASAYLGGMPGGAAPPLGYSAWRGLAWNPTDAANNAISGPNADPDGDGLDNLAEYVLGSFAKTASRDALPTASLTPNGPDQYLTIEYTTLTNLPDVTVRPAVSTDLSVWQTTATGDLTLISSTPNGNGTTTYRYRSTHPYSTTQRHFIHLEITQP